MFTELIAKGLRAQLVGANLLTGQRVIALDFVPDAPPAQLVAGRALPELPTIEASGSSRSRDRRAGCWTSSRRCRSINWSGRSAA